MKNILALIILFSLAAKAQTSYTLNRLSKSGNDVSLQETSAHNVWIGSKLTGTLGQADFSETFLLSGKIVYDLNFGKFLVPIVSNVNLTFNGDPKGFLFGDKGITIGAQPYKVISENENSNLVLHGGLFYKLLPQTSIKLTPQQTKIFGGFEWAYYSKGKDHLPFTISVTPAYLINNLTNANMFALETTAILPLASGFGAIVEFDAPFKKGVESVLKFGIINKLNQ